MKIRLTVKNSSRHVTGFYRAMHYSAKRSIAIVCRLSVCLSVTLVDCDHIGWKSWKPRYMFKRTQSLSNASLRSRPIIIKFM